MNMLYLRAFVKINLEKFLFEDKGWICYTEMQFFVYKIVFCGGIDLMASIIFLSHPKSFSMGNTQNRLAIRAIINVPFTQKT